MIQLIKELKANELKIWLYIYTLRNENQIVFKSAKDIMEDLNISHKTVYDSLRELKNRELIQVNGTKKMIKVLKEPE